MIDLGGSIRPLPVTLPPEQSANNANANDDTFSDEPEESGRVANFFVQTYALCRKNALLLWSGKLRLLLLLILPLLGSILGFAIDSVIRDEIADFYLDDTTSSSNKPLQTCTWKNAYGLPSKDCITFLYAPSDNLVTQDYQVVDKLMEVVAEDNGMTFTPMSNNVPLKNKDYANGYSHDVIGLSSQSLLADYMAQEEGRVSIILLFDYEDYSSSIDYTTTNANLTAYTFTNRTYDYNGEWYSYDATPLRRALDDANVKARLDKPTSVKVTFINDPNNPEDILSRDEFEDMLDEFVPSTIDSFLVISYAFSAILFMNFIAREKQQELIGSLRSMGMHDSAYWMSWNILASLLALVSSILVMIFTYIAKIEELSTLNFFIPFFILWIGQTTLFISNYFLVVLAPTQRVLNGLQFLMVVAFIMGAILPFVYYGRGVPPTFTFLKVVKVFVPSTNFNLIMGNVMSFSRYKLYTNLPDKYNWEMFDTHLDMCAEVETDDDADDDDGIINCIWEQYLDDECRNQVHDSVYDNYEVSCWNEKVAEEDERCNIDHCYYSAEKHSVLLGYMVLQMFVFQLLTWYFFQIIPSGNGIAKRPWFLFEPSFWFQRNPSYERIRSDSQRLKSYESKGLVISNLRKLFKGGKGVQGMNLEIENGQIFCLLGHNGAGKTTLINLLTGKISRDYGEAYFRGLTLSNELNAIQEMTSVVPQHDRLWQELSAYEHVKLFATLKRKGSEENITRLLKKVHLESSKFQASGEYSGGMKRRLSIAIATVGSAKILYMDEPTTGIDPLNRRRIWSLIQDLKKGRIIVLTTHLMQEADVLGDTIGIMDNGALKVKGTPLNLKNHYGSGYTLNIFTSKVDQIDRVCQLAQESITDVDIIDKAATSISLGIPKSEASSIPLFARQMQSEGLIQDWSVSQSTIEEVFLRLVTKQDGSQLNSVQAETIDLTRGEEEALTVEGTNTQRQHEMNADSISFKPSSKAQILALCRKLWIIRKRGRIGSILQLAIPIVMAIVMLIGQNQGGMKPPKDTMRCNDCSSGTRWYSRYYDDDIEILPCEEECELRRSNTYWQTVFGYQIADEISRDDDYSGSYSYYEYSYNEESYDWSQLWRRRLETDLVCDGQTVYLPYYDFYDTLNANVWVTSQSLLFLGQEAGANFVIKEKAEISDMLNYIDSETTFYGSEEDLVGEDALATYNYPRPEYDYWNSWSDGSYLVNDVNDPFVSPEVCKQRECSTVTLYCWSEINTTVIENLEMFEVYDLPHMGIASQISSEDEEEIQFDLNVTFGREPLRKLYCISEGGTCAEGSDLYSIFLEEDYYRYSLYSDIKAASYELIARIFGIPVTKAGEAEFPEESNRYNSRDEYNVYYKPAVPGPAVAVFILLLGISLSFSTISLIFDLVSEKVNGHVFALLLNGMKLRNYWISSYLYQALAFTISSVLYLLLCTIMRVKAINDINWGSMIVLLFLFANGQFAFTCLVSNLFNKPRLASALLMLFVFIICIVMFSLMVTGAISDLPLALDAIPLICFFRGAFFLRTNYRLQSIVYGNLIMISCSIVYFGIGIYFHGSTDKMSFLKNTFSFITSCFRKKTKASNEESDPETAETLDVDVQAEEKRVRNLSPSDTAVKVDSLCKTFKMKGFQYKNAVVDLTLAMDRGEVFGLLGPNGCGKTTSISMITGQLPPSQGQVFVGGFDVVNERVKAMEQLGIVPQFDVLYDELTVCEHLEIYAQMKGVHKSQVKSWALHIAELVSLSNLDLYLRKAKELSGGMRRRLSIGISLLSHPKVLFLDEPTTGLDPDVKRSIWNIIESMRQDRCILLTTHAMDEAEALCNRIGIMAKGSLLCIGTQNHLRSRYGDTFELSFTTISGVTNEEASTQLQDFLEQHFTNVVKVSSYGRSHVFTIARENVDLTSLFEIIINGHSGGLYSEWGIGQSSLDEIFVKITAESEFEE